MDDAEACFILSSRNEVDRTAAVSYSKRLLILTFECVNHVEGVVSLLVLLPFYCYQPILRYLRLVYTSMSAAVRRHAAPLSFDARAF